MSYATEARINNFLGETIEAGSADNFIAAADAHVEMVTDRKFEFSGDATERLFDGNGKQLLLIDECFEIEAVEVGNDTYGESKTATTAYLKLPNNALAKGLPISELLLKNGLWHKGYQNHAITAKWAFSETPPEDIAFAATVIAAGMYAANRSAGSGEVKTESIGAYSVTYDIGSGDGKWGEYKRALDVLQKYRRVTL